MPKIPVPLPSLPPGKGNLNGYFSHSFEEVIIIILVIVIITITTITIITIIITIYRRARAASTDTSHTCSRWSY